MAHVKVSCTTANIGTAPVVKISILTVNAYTPSIFTVNWEFGSQSGTIATRTRHTTFTDYVWPSSFYNEIPDRTSGTGVIIVDCYRGDGTYVETVTTEFTATVNVSASTPTISLPTVYDANPTATTLTGGNGRFIKYVSRANISVNVNARNGATIDEEMIIISNGGQRIYGSSGEINNIESKEFDVRAMDSRSLVTTIKYAIPADKFVEYAKLTCNMGAGIPDTSGNMRLTCSGNYFNDTFGAIHNTLKVQYRYKEQGGSFGSWTNMSASISGNTYSAYADITGLDYRKTYVFECRAQDEVMIATSAGAAVQALPIFHWSADDFVFNVPVTFNNGATGIDGGASSTGTIDGDQLITGDLRLKGSGNYGNTLYFGDGSYCYLQEGTDDDLTIKASDLNLNVSNLYLNGGAIKAGTWTPTLTSSSAVSSYTTRSGWYVRVGNVVTVGFNIGASCNSGYNSTALAISGLPFTPATNAFGGGVMFGAYVNAGFCFEAWAATTGGQITPRLQPCNNTTAGNLQIASTAYYPSGANSLTLGGTITYITN